MLAQVLIVPSRQTPSVIGMIVSSFLSQSFLNGFSATAGNCVRVFLSGSLSDADGWLRDLGGWWFLWYLVASC